MYDDPSADPNDQMDETSPEQEEATFSKMHSKMCDRCTAGGWNTTILDRTPDIIWDYFLEENM